MKIFHNLLVIWVYDPQRIYHNIPYDLSKSVVIQRLINQTLMLGTDLNEPEVFDIKQCSTSSPSYHTLTLSRSPRQAVKSYHAVWCIWHLQRIIRHIRLASDFRWYRKNNKRYLNASNISNIVPIINYTTDKSSIHSTIKCSPKKRHPQIPICYTSK